MDLKECDGGAHGLHQEECMSESRPFLKAFKRRNLPPYRTLGCVMTHSRTQWCYGLCKPTKGIGQCGRLYPHFFKGRTQRAIARYNVRMKAQEDRS
jgi:hypothetical protein